MLVVLCTSSAQQVHLHVNLSSNLAVHPVKSPYKSYLHSKLVRPDVKIGEILQDCSCIQDLEADFLSKISLKILN